MDDIINELGTLRGEHYNANLWYKVSNLLVIVGIDMLNITTMFDKHDLIKVVRR